MRGFGHGVQAGFQNCIAAHGAKAIAALVQALKGRSDFMHAGDLALPHAKVQITLGHALGVRVARSGQGFSRHFGTRAIATPLLADQTQQICQHVFKAFKMHHGVVVLHG